MSGKHRWRQPLDEYSSSAEESGAGKDFEAEAKGCSHHADTSSSSSKDYTSKVKELSSKLESDLVINDKENKKGEFLLEHPWNKCDPTDDLPMEDTVTMSKTYPVREEWTTNGKPNLKNIYSNLPIFIEQMKEKSTPIKELTSILGAIHATPDESTSALLERIRAKASPFSKEILDKKDKVFPTDKRSAQEVRFKASSLPELPQKPLRKEENYCYLNCEYIMHMYVPSSCFSWFNMKGKQKKWTTKIGDGEVNKRWVFIPSYRRAKIALLEWPEEGDPEVAREKTHRILVVRPSEFDDYVQYCGQRFPVICLPNDEIGVGYARFWIQKIALHLGLQFVWIIDDSLECFYEYHPKKPPPARSYVEWRRRKFGLVFKRIEGFVKCPKKCKKPIVAMSPRRFNAGRAVKNAFTCKPPQTAVFLDLRALESKRVHYRPELKSFEDMIFAYECEQKGLKVFVDNRIHLADHHHWKDTGARSHLISP